MTSDQLHLRIRRGGYIKQRHSSQEGMYYDTFILYKFIDGARNLQDSSGPLAAQEGGELCLPDEKRTWSQARSVESRQP